MDLVQLEEANKRTTASILAVKAMEMPQAIKTEILNSLALTRAVSTLVTHNYILTKDNIVCDFSNPSVEAGIKRMKKMDEVRREKEATRKRNDLFQALAEEDTPAVDQEKETEDDEESHSTRTNFISKLTNKRKKYDVRTGVQEEFQF